MRLFLWVPWDVDLNALFTGLARIDLICIFGCVGRIDHGIFLFESIALFLLGHKQISLFSFKYLTLYLRLSDLFPLEQIISAFLDESDLTDELFVLL